MTLRILKKIGGTATLVDYSAEALRVARQNSLRYRLVDRITFVQENVFNFIPRQGYDLVHSAGLIEHYPTRLNELLKKHIQCANADGYVIIMVPAPIWWYKLMRCFLENFHIWPKSFELPLDKYRLKSIAEESGLKILKSLQSSGLARASAILGVPSNMYRRSEL